MSEVDPRGVWIDWLTKFLAGLLFIFEISDNSEPCDESSGVDAATMTAVVHSVLSRRAAAQLRASC